MAENIIFKRSHFIAYTLHFGIHKVLPGYRYAYLFIHCLALCLLYKGMNGSPDRDHTVLDNWKSFPFWFFPGNICLPQVYPTGLCILFDCCCSFVGCGVFTCFILVCFRLAFGNFEIGFGFTAHPGLSQISGPPASASQVLGLGAYTTMLGRAWLW